MIKKFNLILRSDFKSSRIGSVKAERYSLQTKLHPVLIFRTLKFSYKHSSQALLLWNIEAIFFKMNLDPIGFPNSFQLKSRGFDIEKKTSYQLTRRGGRLKSGL